MKNIEREKMSGRINVLVAEEKDEKTVRIYRVLNYRRVMEIEKNDQHQENMLAIYNSIRILMRRVSAEVVAGTEEGIMGILRQIVVTYSNLIQYLEKFQERLPRTLIRFYEFIDVLQLDIIPPSKNIVGNIEPENVAQFLRETQIMILSFWQKNPETFIRLSPLLIKGFCTPEIFLQPEYFPYTMGNRELPDWMDPYISQMMNEARKIHQTREQTTIQHKVFSNYLSIISRSYRGFSREIIGMVVEYIPIDVVFDLMNSKTLTEFAASHEAKKYEKYETGSLVCIYVT